MIHLIYLMDRIIYQLYKIIIKKHEAIAETAPILIYTNKMKETMKLLGSTKDTIDADKNSENVPKLEMLK